MTDATTGPGAGAKGTPAAPAEDNTKRNTVAPTPPETTERDRDAAGRETAPGDERRQGRTVAPTPPEATDSEGTDPDPHGTRLLRHEECDKLELRLRQAVSGFVDGPRHAVEEADQVVEEIAGRFTEAVTRRRRTLRMSWQEGDRAEASHSGPDTEQLRLALRDYRELAERLLRS